MRVKIKRKNKKNSSNRLFYVLHLLQFARVRGFVSTQSFNSFIGDRFLFYKNHVRHHQESPAIADGNNHSRNYIAFIILPILCSGLALLSAIIIANIVN